MALPAELIGPRLILRAWSENHIDPVLDAVAASLLELRPWMPWAQQVPTRDEELQILRGGRQRFQQGEDFPLFLFERDTEELAGAAGLHPRQPGVAEVGYWIRTDRHRRGYATEAVRILTDAAFAHVPEIHTLEIRMDKANHASAAVPPKAGYTLTGEEATRERLAPGHTGHGWIWTLERAAWSTRQP